ncbi:MAG: response regulator [Bdellovibrionales bacterium]|nr:response regulator [Bdellovibrionales bacterium]
MKKNLNYIIVFLLFLVFLPIAVLNINLKKIHSKIEIDLSKNWSFEQSPKDLPITFLSQNKKHVLVNEFTFNHFDSDFYLVLGRVGDKEEVYLNGCDLGSFGEVRDGKLVSWWYGALRVLKIPSECLKSQNQLIVEISSFSTLPQGIFSSKVGISGDKSLLSLMDVDDWMRYKVIFSFAMVILAIGLYYFLVFMLVPGRSSNKYFSLLCISLSVFLALTSTIPYRYFENQTLLMSLNFFTGILSLFLLTKFIGLIFKNDHLVVRKIFLGVSSVLFLYSLFEWKFSEISKIYSYWYPVFIVYLLVNFVRLFLINSIEFLKKQYLYLMGFCVLIFTLIFDVLASIGIINSQYLLPYGFTFILLASAIALAKEYADAFLYVEEQVKERTIDLNTALEELKSLEKMKERFFANISHDLKTPITVAMGALEDASEKFAPMIGGALAPAERSLHKLRSMVSSILDSVKAESGTLSLTWESVHVTSFLDLIVQDARLLCKRSNVEFLYNEQGFEGLYVPMDQDKMRRVLENILSNAVKYTKTTDKSMKKIQIVLETDQSNFHMYVDDSGLGVPEDERERVFERFVQSSKTDLKQHGGSGIGLSFVKEVVDLHNGEVTMEESQWGGSRVHIMLPLSQNVALTESQIKIDEKMLMGSLDVEYPPSKPDKIDPTKCTVLTCEDNPEVAQIIHTTLKDRYNIYFAENGEEGWKLLQTISPDCIVSDIQMPVMTGMAFLEKIRERREYDHIPFIFLTSLGADQDIIDGFRLGAMDYIAKPFRKEVLRTRILAHIERKIFFEQLTRSEKMSMIGTMFAGIAHEMKNPLQSLVNNHAMIEKIVKEKRFEEKYDVLDRAIHGAVKKTENLTQLISTVNEYSSGSENKNKMDVKQKIEDALMLLEAKRKEKDFIEITKTFPEKEVMVEGYNSLLQVMTNLIANAIDAVEKTTGHIHIELSQTDDKVTFSVKDDGIGIPKSILPHIFDPFVTTKDPSKGTGLGLFMTRTIVEERHGGDIHVESQEGKGTTFIITIPKIAPDHATQVKPFHKSV